MHCMLILLNMVNIHVRQSSGFGAIERLSGDVCVPH